MNKSNQDQKFARKLSRMSRKDRILSKWLMKGKLLEPTALALNVLVQKALNKYEKV